MSSRQPTDGNERGALDMWRRSNRTTAMRILRDAGYTTDQRAAFLREVADCTGDVVTFASDEYLEPPQPTPARVLYIYATARDDGFGHAVGEYLDDDAPAVSALALFQHEKDAHTFAYARQTVTGGMVHVLPSIE